jgi:hypothetical protein
MVWNIDPCYIQLYTVIEQTHTPLCVTESRFGLQTFPDMPNPFRSKKADYFVSSYIKSSTLEPSIITFAFKVFIV